MPTSFATAIGFYLSFSNDNTISNNEISHSECFGVLLEDSGGNTISSNVIDDTQCGSTTPAVGIALIGDSDRNLILVNSVSSSGSSVVAGDGINVGCKDGCQFMSATSGADDNRVAGNRVTNNTRYGIAQAPGNTGNIYRGNAVSGNGTDFAIEP